MTVQPKHRRRNRRGRPHEQFTVAMAILALVMSGGMVAGLASSLARSGSGVCAAVTRRRSASTSVTGRRRASASKSTSSARMR